MVESGGRDWRRARAEARGRERKVMLRDKERERETESFLFPRETGLFPRCHNHIMRWRLQENSLQGRRLQVNILS